MPGGEGCLERASDQKERKSHQRQIGGSSVLMVFTFIMRPWMVPLRDLWLDAPQFTPGENLRQLGQI